MFQTRDSKIAVFSIILIFTFGEIVVIGQESTSSRRPKKTIDQEVSSCQTPNFLELAGLRSVVDTSDRIVFQATGVPSTESESSRREPVQNDAIKALPASAGKPVVFDFDIPAKDPVTLVEAPPMESIGAGNPCLKKSSDRTENEGQLVASTISSEEAFEVGNSKSEVVVASAKSEMVEPVPNQPRINYVFPRLIDPEAFRINRRYRNQEMGTQQESDFLSSTMDDVKRGVEVERGSWLNQLPRPTLAQGVRERSMQRAASNQEFNPILNYANVVELASDYRPESTFTVKTWRSPNMCHRPIYFEDEELERYGHGIGNLQPVVSGTKFFATAMLLPYHVGAQSPSSCVYEMGYYRPGDCNPAHKKCRTINRRGLFYQLVTFGLVFGGL